MRSKMNNTYLASRQSISQAIESIEDVSLPRMGEWGNILSFPEWHYDAYEKAITSVLAASETSIDKDISSMIQASLAVVCRCQSEIGFIVTSSKTLNDSGSVDFDNILTLHGRAISALRSVFRDVSIRFYECN